MKFDRGIKVGKVAWARLSPKLSRGICPSRKTIGEAMTYTIHCSKKLLDRVKPLVNAEQTAPNTYLGNWYATPLFWKPQVALLVNELTLLPVLMPLAPAAELAKRFPDHLASVLLAHGAPHALIEHELKAMLDFQYAKSTNRSLIGMLNQFTYLAEGYRGYNQITDLNWLSMKLSETPCRPLHKKAISPDRELRRLIETEWRINAANDQRY
jgi:hypothetical protein